MKWLYKDSNIDTLPTDNPIGFVYKITYELDDETFVYYGKKNVLSETKKYLTKKEMANVTDKRLKNYKMVVKENNWRQYAGSCNHDILQKCIMVEKEILQFAYTKIELTYLEAKLLFINEALEDKYCLNSNILGKFFRGKVCQTM